MTTMLFSGRLSTLEANFYCGDGPALSVRSFTLEEAIDVDYEAEVMLASEVEVDIKAMLGADCTLVVSRDLEERRRVYGVIDRVEDLGEIDHLNMVRVHVVPAFSLIGMGQNTRIWQDASVRDIVGAVLDPALGAYGRVFEFGHTTRGGRVRDYCVQFRESDRAFVCRLLEEEGIAYDFVHSVDSDAEVLWLRDRNEQYSKAVNVDGSSEIPLIEHDADLADVESVQTFEHGYELTVTGCFRRDYDWRAPRNWLNDTTGGRDERSRERRIYLHEQRRYIHDDLTEQSHGALEAELFDGQFLEGRSNMSGFESGRRFELTNTATEYEGEYLIKRISHEFHDDDEHGGVYQNVFSCVPVSITHRPRRRAPRPRVHGPHTATVVGDDEIHTDEHGRIQVQFHWEETPSYAAGASCWIRCAQSWSGPGWGAQFIPRRGMEVVVEFLEGNPDRPLVTGCVYNGRNDHPFVVPQHKTQSGWRTRSSPDSEGYNMLRFEDATGNEEIHVHGQKDLSIIIEHNKDQEIRNDETLHVCHDRTKTVSHHEWETIEQSRWITVGLMHNEVIGANKTETVGVDSTLSVGQVMTTTVGKDMSTVVGENMNEDVGESRGLTVAVDNSEDVGSNKTVEVGKEYRIDVGNEFILICGESSIVLKKDGSIRLRGSRIEMETSGDTVVNAKYIRLN